MSNETVESASMTDRNLVGFMAFFYVKRKCENIKTCKTNSQEKFTRSINEQEKSPFNTDAETKKHINPRARLNFIYIPQEGQKPHKTISIQKTLAGEFL